MVNISFFECRVIHDQQKNSKFLSEKRQVLLLRSSLSPSNDGSSITSVICLLTSYSWLFPRLKSVVEVYQYQGEATLSKKLLRTVISGNPWTLTVNKRGNDIIVMTNWMQVKCCDMPKTPSAKAENTSCFQRYVGFWDDFLPNSIHNPNCTFISRLNIPVVPCMALSVWCRLQGAR